MLWNILTEETAPPHALEGNPCCCCAVFRDKEYRAAEVVHVFDALTISI